MVLAIEYLHQNNIIYRDLKPENVLIDRDGYIRLTDFGLSKRNVIGEKDAFSVCGTPEYLAPEVLLKQGHGKPVDWWTLGCIIYEMVTGQPPYYSSNRQDLFEKIKHALPKLPNTLSKNIRNLLEMLFQKKPEERLGSDGAEKIKSHPWFQKVDWERIYNKQIIPPFVPVLQSESDTQNFDPEFTGDSLSSFNESLPGSSAGK